MRYHQLEIAGLIALMGTTLEALAHDHRFSVSAIIESMKWLLIYSGIGAVIEMILSGH
jgi:hypothetical protein